MMTSKPETAVGKRFEAAKRFAREGGLVTLRYFRREFTVERKADNSPVTEADREAERQIRELIGAEFPDDGIIGEEFGEVEGTSGFVWVLDPIDGTRSFIHGVPLYGTMVGVLQDKQPVVGVVEIPGLDERMAGGPEVGAWYQRGNTDWVQAKVSDVDSLADGLFATSEITGFAERGSQAAFVEMSQRARLTRTWGDCYGYLLVVTGRAEVMIDAQLNIWDAAAVAPILRAAGGKFTDWAGNPSISAGEAVGTNGHIHAEVLEILGAASGARIA